MFKVGDMHRVVILGYCSSISVAARPYFLIKRIHGARVSGSMRRSTSRCGGFSSGVIANNAVLVRERNLVARGDPNIRRGGHDPAESLCIAV